MYPTTIYMNLDAFGPFGADEKWKLKQTTHFPEATSHKSEVPLRSLHPSAGVLFPSPRILLAFPDIAAFPPRGFRDYFL